MRLLRLMARDLFAALRFFFLFVFVFGSFPYFLENAWLDLSPDETSPRAFDTFSTVLLSADSSAPNLRRASGREIPPILAAMAKVFSSGISVVEPVEPLEEVLNFFTVLSALYRRKPKNKTKIPITENTVI